MDDFHFGTLTGVSDGIAQFDRGASLASFYKRSVIHPFDSEKQGRPVYVSRDFVRIFTPGERDEIDREVLPADKHRWKEEWRQYQDGLEQEPDGTPLAHLFPGSPEIVENLRSLKFATVEQLGAASDTAMERIGLGGLEFRSKAQRFLEGSKEGAQFAKLERLIKEQNDKIAELHLANEELAARVSEGEAEKAKPQSASRR